LKPPGTKSVLPWRRGPLNIASFLMGTTEFLMAMLTDPELVEILLRKITEFLKNGWTCSAGPIHRLMAFFLLVTLAVLLANRNSGALGSLF
jgi:hypothetical protein